MTGKGENAVRQRLNYLPDSEITVELSWHGITNVGLRREDNQDSYVLAPPVFAVADGMGGHAGGEIASAAVTTRLAELAGKAPVTTDDLITALDKAVDDIEAQAGLAADGAGTTVTGLVLGSDPETPTWNVFNIGDSRVYQYFKGALVQITSDHSVVQHLVDTGAITPEEAEVHPHANVITRAVGTGEDPVPDTVELALIPGQRLLICSDGLTKELTDLGIQHFLAEAESAQAAAETLMEQALGNAGRDNISIIVVEVHAVGDVRDTLDINALQNAEIAAQIAVAEAEKPDLAVTDFAQDTKEADAVTTAATENEAEAAETSR